MPNDRAEQSIERAGHNPAARVNKSATLNPDILTSMQTAPLE